MRFVTESTSAPQRVRLEHLPGRTVVRLADNITQRQDEDENTVYVWDEAEFDAPPDRELTAESVEEDFAAWWEYGEQEITVPTLEQRVSDLEEVVVAMLGEV